MRFLETTEITGCSPAHQRLRPRRRDAHRDIHRRFCGRRHRPAARVAPRCRPHPRHHTLQRRQLAAESRTHALPRHDSHKKSNDDWFRDPSVRVDALALGATSADAAILIFLEPGAYTVQVTPPGQYPTRQHDRNRALGNLRSRAVRWRITSSPAIPASGRASPPRPSSHPSARQARRAEPPAPAATSRAGQTPAASACHPARSR